MEKELQFKDVDIFDNFIEISKSCRLYYERILYDNDLEGKTGFEFIALGCTGWECDGKNEYNFSTISTVEIVVSGRALFDGMRHLYYGDEKSDNYGYHYYPNLEQLIKIMQELKKLEQRYCQE